MRRDNQCFVACLALTFLMLASVACAGESENKDFCVDTEVFRAGQPNPISSTSTFFVENRVYDVMLSGPREAALIDLEGRTILLFDPGRQVATQLDFQDLIKFVVAFQAAAAKRPGLPRFAAKPEFQEVLDAATGNLSLRSQFIVYDATTEAPPRDDISLRYKEFADWSARLNSTISFWPPAPRLHLNRSVADRGRWPSSVRLAIKDAGKVVQDLRSQHQLRLELTDRDRAQVGQVDSYRRDFRQIPFTQYRPLRPTPLAKREKPQNAK